MPGDYSRTRYTPRKGYISILEQQGRVRLDADGNEFAEAINRRRRAETIDTIGNGVVPTTTKNAFQILSPAPNQYTIGPGRAYVDGILVDCWGDDASDVFTPDLGELLGTNPLAYNNQPFFYSPGFPEPAGAGTSIVYLDAWEREVTALDVLEQPGTQKEYQSLIDPALEGIDTTTRMQVAWQVKALSPTTAAVCSDDPPEWTTLIAPSTGVLTTATTPAPSTASACVIDPSGGYTGLENRLYRVQIYKSGVVDPTGGTVATFVWSKDNASVGANLVSPITHVSATECQLAVTTVGRDKTLRFQVNDVLEVLDDFVEWSIRETNQGGTFVTVTSVDAENLTINVTPDISGTFTVVSAQHPRIRKWEALPQPTNNGTAIALGTEGVTITFGATAAATLRAGDYWTFCARTATGTIEILNNAPPRGVLHHYMRLAVTNPPNVPQDCRTFWPPAFGGEGCCTVVVNVGDDIQKAIDSLPRDGGCVCLKAGVHAISSPINITERTNILIHGESTAAVVQNAASTTVLKIGTRSSDIAVEWLSLIGTPQTLEENGVITILDGVRCAVRHCKITCDDSEKPPIVPIALLVHDANQIEVSNTLVSGVVVGMLAFDVSDLTATENIFSGLTTVDDNGNTVSGGASGIDLIRHQGIVNISSNEFADFALGVSTVTFGETTDGNVFPMQTSISDNIIRRHLAPPGSGTSIGWTDPIGTLLQNKVYGILTDATDATIAKNTIEIADPLEGGILVYGPGVAVRDNTIVSSITPPAPPPPQTLYDWNTLPVGIVVYKPAQNAAVDHCRVSGNTLTGPLKGIALLAEFEDAVNFTVIEDNQCVNTAVLETLDLTQQPGVLSTLETALGALGTAFGVLMINAHQSQLIGNSMSSCTVGITCLKYDANLDRNFAEGGLVGLFLNSISDSVIQNGTLSNNQLGAISNATNNVIVAGNACTETVLVGFLSFFDKLVRFERNQVQGAANGFLLVEGQNSRVDRNTVLYTGGTGIMAFHCGWETFIEGNDVQGCGTTGQSAIEAAYVSQQNGLSFGTAVSASIAAVNCSGVVTVDSCEVRDSAQVSTNHCVDICCLNAAHTRVRNCRIVRAATFDNTAPQSRGLLVQPTIDEEDPSLMSVDASGNHIDIVSPTPGAKIDAAAVDIETVAFPFTKAPCDVLFSGNYINQRGTRYDRPFVVRLWSHVLVVTGNRIRSTMPSLEIEAVLGLTYLGNILSQKASVVVLLGGTELPTPDTNFNVTA